MQRDTMTVPESEKRLDLGRVGIHEARTRLQDNCYTAANMLIAIMNDHDALSTTRVIAAKSVIELAFRPVE